jgi:hypothetical protein
LSQPGGPLYNIELSNGGLITFPGGLVLTAGKGEVIGCKRSACARGVTVSGVQ